MSTPLEKLAEFVGKRRWPDDTSPSASTNTIAYHAEEAVNDHLTDPGPVMDHWATLDVNVRAGYRTAWRRRVAEVVHASKLTRVVPELIAVVRWAQEIRSTPGASYPVGMGDALDALDARLEELDEE